VNDHICVICRQPIDRVYRAVAIKDGQGLVYLAHDACNAGLNEIVAEKEQAVEQAETARKAHLVSQAEATRLRAMYKQWGELSEVTQARIYQEFVDKHQAKDVRHDDETILDSRRIRKGSAVPFTVQKAYSPSWQRVEVEGVASWKRV